jgi:hypothetical protein
MSGYLWLLPEPATEEEARRRLEIARGEANSRHRAGNTYPSVWEGEEAMDWKAYRDHLKRILREVYHDAELIAEEAARLEAQAKYEKESKERAEWEASPEGKAELARRAREYRHREDLAGWNGRWAWARAHIHRWRGLAP